MRSVNLSLVIGALLVGAIGCSETAPAPSATGETAITTVSFDPQQPVASFNVPQMACQDHCVKVVAQTLKEMPGVKAVDIEFETKTARVNIEEGAFDADAALAKLAEQGYDETTVASTD